MWQQSPPNTALTLTQCEVKIAALRSMPGFRDFQRPEHNEILAQLEVLYARQSSLQAERDSVSPRAINSRLTDLENERLKVRNQINEQRATPEFKDWAHLEHDAKMKEVNLLYDRENALLDAEKSLQEEKQKLPPFDPNKAWGNEGRRVQISSCPPDQQPRDQPHKAVRSYYDNRGDN